MGHRSRALIEQSLALIAKGHTLICQTQRRILLIVGGGSTALAERHAPASTATNRRSLTEPVIPRIYGGRSRGDTTCSRCGRTIAPAAVEYEVDLQTETLLLDRECFVREEAKNFGLPLDCHE